MILSNDFKFMGWLGSFSSLNGASVLIALVTDDNAGLEGAQLGWLILALCDPSAPSRVV